ncbi:MAG: carbohydrate ABC transporter permease [Anaerolineales bacterium]
MQPSSVTEQTLVQRLLTQLTSTLGRLIAALIVPVITFLILWQGFIFLRDSQAPKVLIAFVAITWGVGGVALLYLVSNWLVEQLPPEWVARIQPFVFIGPAAAILVWYLALPTVRTLFLSLFGATGPNFPPLLLLFTAPSDYWGDLVGPNGLQFPDFSLLFDSITHAEFWSIVSPDTGFVGLANYMSMFDGDNPVQRIMFEAFRNNLLWIVVGATFSVAFGLLVAVLADRSRFENYAKALIFLPMAISMVGAGVIWNFIFEVKDVADPQIGLLNAIWVGLGGEPQAWTALLQPYNNLFLILIAIWLQTGFAMVLFSAAIKGIPGELLEAARVDGANEVQIFFRIMLPYIQGTIITVATTIVIFLLKIFDIVQVMTGGQFGTHVIATQFYRQFFTNRNFGFGSTIAIILLLAVVPVMVYNLRQFSKREAF